jgi:hypothetical protein
MTNPRKLERHLPRGGPKPAATTKVRVFLDSVLCAATEDVTGPDEFYLTGAISTDPEHTKAVLTNPLTINSDEDKPFGVGGGLVWEADVDNSSWLKIALLGYDEDAAKDWEKNKEWVQEITDALVTALAAAGESKAATLVKLVPTIVGGIFKLDQDDHLGDIAVDLQVGQLEPGLTRKAGVIEGRHLRSHYRYMVAYSILVGDTVPQQTSLMLIKAAHSDKLLDVARAEHRNGAPVIQYSQHGRANQRFALEPVGGDYYRIVAQHSGKCLTVKDGSRAAGTPVEQWTYSGGEHQQWKMEREPGGGVVDVRFINKASGLYLSVRKGDKKDSAVVEIAPRGLTSPDRTPSPSLNQLFHLLTV